MRQLPLVPTIMVAIMTPILIGLGIWQLQRASWKTGMLESLETARTAPPLRIDGAAPDGANFRRAKVTLLCPEFAPIVMRAGQNRSGDVGYSYFIKCRSGNGRVPYELNAGWAQRPGRVIALPLSGEISGRLVEIDRGPADYVLVADRAIAPLEPSAPPTPKTIPNNHMGYAMQWFFFAVTLLLIYALYVRRRVQ